MNRVFNLAVMGGGWASVVLSELLNGELLEETGIGRIELQERFEGSCAHGISLEMVAPQDFSEDHTDPAACHFITPD